MAKAKTKKLPLLNQNGENVGEVKVATSVFAIEPNEQAIFDAVLVARTNSRQDTSKTKKRDEVSGGGKKPWRQKGTGRARQGSTRAPQWRHGGIVFGPTGVQNHEIKMNRKVRQLALKSALSQKLADKELIVVDKFDFEAPKTKLMAASLKALNADNKKTLLVVGEESFSENAIYSVCNLPTVGVLYYDQINVYDIVNSDVVVITKEALSIIEEGLNNG